MGNENFFILLLTLACLLNGEATGGFIGCNWTPNLTVALDGSGDHTRISDAVNSVHDNSNFKFFIHVKAGLYEENVVVPEKKRNIFMFGDGSRTTIISGRRNRVDEPNLKTFETATFCKSL